MTSILEKVLAWLRGEKRESEEPAQVLAKKRPEPFKELQNIEEDEDVIYDYTMFQTSESETKDETES